MLFTLTLKRTNSRYVAVDRRTPTLTLWRHLPLKLFPHSDPTIVILLCLFYSFTCITFSFVCSTFFSHAKTGGVVGYMVFFVSSLPALALKGPGIPAWAKVRVCWNIQRSEMMYEMMYTGIFTRRADTVASPQRAKKVCLYVFSMSVQRCRGQVSGGRHTHVLIAYTNIEVTSSLPSPPPPKILCSLLAPCGFSFGMEALNAAEAQGVGITWGNIANPSITPLGVPFYAFILVIFFDVLLYAALAWYVSHSLLE